MPHTHDDESKPASENEGVAGKSEPTAGNNSNWPGVLVVLIGALGTGYGVYMNHKSTPDPGVSTLPASVTSTNTPAAGASGAVQSPPHPRHQPPIPNHADNGPGLAVPHHPAQPPAQPPVQPPAQPPAKPPIQPPIQPPMQATPQTFPTLVLQQFDAAHNGFAGHTEWRFAVFVNDVQVGKIPQVDFHHLPHSGTVNDAGWVSWTNVHIKPADAYNIVVHAYRPNEDPPRGESGSGTIQAMNGAAAIRIKGGGIAAPYDFTLTFTIVGAP